jgi:hypothetical protein
MLNLLKRRRNGHDIQAWRCHTRVDKYLGELEYMPDESGLLVPVAQPYEVLEKDGNLLVIGGASVQWQTLIGNGTGTASQALTFFNNANAAIGVGDSTTAAADTQTDLSAATNKVRKAMDATYPLHTDTTGTAGSKSITFRSTFATGDANWAWQEWGIFNSPIAATGRMLNRKVESLGTKTSAATWVLTITLSLA